MWGGRVLTEVSQAGESGRLQCAVVGESLTGSHCNPLHAIQHQHVVVTLCTMEHTQQVTSESSVSVCQPSACKHVGLSEQVESKHRRTDSEDSLISQTVLSGSNVNMWRDAPELFTGLRKYANKYK